MSAKIKISDHFTYSKLFRFVLPSILMMVFTSIYSVVDGYFVSNYTGKTPFAAINLIWPFINLLSGVGFMLGTGGSALVSMVLGQGDDERANRYFSMVLEFLLVLSAIMVALGHLLLPAVARALGASDAMMPYCLLYARILITFLPAVMLQLVFQSLLVTAERPQLGFIVTLLAGFTNMILDWLFVAVLGFGIAGAAWATILSQCAGGLVPLIYFILPNSSLLRFRPTRLDLPVLLKACGNGASELMSNISGSIVSMAYNAQLLRFAGENGVAAYGVVMYVCFIFIAIFVGYSVGTTPVVGYHYGAGHHDEMHNLLTKSLKIMAVFGVCMLALSYVLARPLALLYVGYDETLCEITENGFHIFSFSFLLSGVNIFLSSFFTALNNGAVSAAISFLRTLVFELASVMILPLIFGVNGIWCAVAVAEVCAVTVSLFFLKKYQAKYGY